MDHQPLREVTQTILWSPEHEAREVYGNCLQAAMASALGLDLDAVPNFAAFTWWDAAARLWLRGRSLDWRWVPASAGLPDERCVIVGTSPRPTGRHAVAGDGGRVVWDPHPSRAGLTEIQGAYVFRRWPRGADDDEGCVCCGDQLRALAATGEAP
jgi:hypothetical protein